MHNHKFVECIYPRCTIKKRHQHCNQNCIAIRKITLPYKEA